MYTLIHICIRSDGYNFSRTVNITDFETLIHATNTASSYIPGNSGEIVKNLSEGKPYWVWKRNHNGNGDYYEIIEKMNRVKEINYIFNLSDQESNYDLLYRSFQVEEF